MAAIKGITVEELAGLDEDEVADELDEQLAELDDDGFEDLVREIDEVTQH